MKITLIGLGVGEGGLTLEAKRALDGASRILARTSATSSFASLKQYDVQTLDSLFSSSRTFDSLNKKLAKEVLAAAKQSDVCYCVDGGVCEDEACRIICSKSKNVRIIEGVTKSSHAAALAKLGRAEYLAASAYAAEGIKSCNAAVIYDIDGDYIASVVKQRLSDIFGEDTVCTFIRGESVKKIKVYEIDRQKNYDYSCAVAVEQPEFLNKARYDYADLEQIIRMLRAPGGCPWDRAQTCESIKGNVIEEAYELADAVERGDGDGIEEETGDILLQAAFYSVLKSEQGAFNGGDALTRVIKKLIFRHSHIFGGDKASTESEALGVWEKNKAEEKGQKAFGERVAAVPRNFPSCTYAQKVLKRSAESGMDFLSPVSAAESMQDDVKKLIGAAISGDEKEIFNAAGDVLLSAVNTCRLAGADCEQSLRAAAFRFAERFIKCEQLIVGDGKNITQLLDDELNVYWWRAGNALKED